ncbi:protein SSUH2 homolog isoform X2 [Dendronephthya gigantea]|uniref:protein SSUH2 homolog isoform X2 n=1 Tax=Dendronephthya gigantea TaxID=151771 RepID=UPI001069BE3E|nr:protein SSUH2 homolog isoform X2 [Dendronephthya gigantea]
MYSQNPGYPPQGAGGYPPQGAGGYPPQAGAPGGPPATLFEAVAGYEKTVFGQGYAPPPPTAPPMPEQSRPDEEFVSGAAITSEEAQEAMENFVASQCCYGSSPAKEMVIQDITPTSAYHYKLTTFTESRQTAWQYEPFTGQVVDGPHNGPAPGPWNINVQPSKMFSPTSTKVEVPHTASVKQCHECYGGGYKQCKTCLGRGWSKCNTCNGHGHVKDNFGEEKQCTFCSGAGEGRCSPCNGGGRIKCEVCQGHSRLKTFIQLTVTWKNHDSEKTIERTQGGPKEKVKDATGLQIFHQQLPRVWPITTFFDNEINSASQQFVNEHATSWPQERILMQNHILRAIPVAEVSYVWKGDSYRFWVYGKEPRQVFAPDYPQQCCCGCVIL